MKPFCTYSFWYALFQAVGKISRYSHCPHQKRVRPLRLWTWRWMWRITGPLNVVRETAFERFTLRSVNRWRSSAGGLKTCGKLQVAGLRIELVLLKKDASSLLLCPSGTLPRPPQDLFPGQLERSKGYLGRRSGSDRFKLSPRQLFWGFVFHSLPSVSY